MNHLYTFIQGTYYTILHWKRKGKRKNNNNNKPPKHWKNEKKEKYKKKEVKLNWQYLCWFQMNKRTIKILLKIHSMIFFCLSKVYVYFLLNGSVIYYPKIYFSLSLCFTTVFHIMMWRLFSNNGRCSLNLKWFKTTKSSGFI